MDNNTFSTIEIVNYYDSPFIKNDLFTLTYGYFDNKYYILMYFNEKLDYDSIDFFKNDICKIDYIGIYEISNNVKKYFYITEINIDNINSNNYINYIKNQLYDIKYGLINNKLCIISILNKEYEPYYFPTLYSNLINNIDNNKLNGQYVYIDVIKNINFGDDIKTSLIRFIND